LRFGNLLARHPTHSRRGKHTHLALLLPNRIEAWPLTSLPQRLLKTGGRWVNKLSHKRSFCGNRKGTVSTVPRKSPKNKGFSP
jgi:hypothetical protein